ncbi:MAG: hypothetical protein N3D19_03765, partial [Archaeoglobaceae archaeon]|nr:hypothetical protein [Archaeoglobaceae archaeon]
MRHEEEIKKLREEVNELRKEMYAGFKRHDELLMRHEEEIKKLREDMNEGFRRVWIEIGLFRKEFEKEIREIRTFMERLSISLEEEANYVVSYFLEKRGIKVSTGRFFLDTEYEFDIYGKTDDLTVVGEAKTRVSPNNVHEMLKKIDDAMKKYPEFFKGKVLKVLYCMVAIPGTIEEANRSGIWIIKSAKEINEPQI